MASSSIAISRVVKPRLMAVQKQSGAIRGTSSKHARAAMTTDGNQSMAVSQNHAWGGGSQWQSVRMAIRQNGNQMGVVKPLARRMATVSSEIM